MRKKYLSDRYGFYELQAEKLANILICLINQASYLLWQQMKSQENYFLNNGGFSERMFKARRESRWQI